MAKRTSSVLLILFVVTMASAANMARAGLCTDGVGDCKDCDLKCKAKHGPTGRGMCDTSLGTPLCTCAYLCGKPDPPPKPPTCKDGLGLCSPQCNNDCCNQKCASKHRGDHGFCNTLGSSSLCECDFPC